MLAEIQRAGRSHQFITLEAGKTIDRHEQVEIEVFVHENLIWYHKVINLGQSIIIQS